MSIVSLALTPVELTAVRVYLEEGIDEYGQNTCEPQSYLQSMIHPVGSLVVAFLVLQHVSKALSLAHDQGVVHSDLRIGSVVLASWSIQDNSFVKHVLVIEAP